MISNVVLSINAPTGFPFARGRSVRRLLLSSRWAGLAIKDPLGIGESLDGLKNDAEGLSADFDGPHLAIKTHSDTLTAQALLDGYL